VHRSIWIIAGMASGLALAFGANLSGAAGPEIPPPMERVELLADTLRPYALGHGFILEPSRPEHLELADHSTLVLDRDTPAGNYRLSDGRTIEIRRPSDAPPQVTAIDRPVRVLPFALHTSRGAGLIVQALGDTAVLPDSTMIRGFLQRPVCWLGGEYEVWKRVDVRHGDISEAWCANGHVPMPDTLQGLARITWLTFETPWVQAARTLLARGERIGGRISEYGEIRDGLRRQPLGSVIGSVVVDLASGRVVQRRGRIR
jgi:hypothetical protein